MGLWTDGYDSRLPIQGPGFETTRWLNVWLSFSSSIKVVWEAPGNLVVKSKLSPVGSGDISIKMGNKDFFYGEINCADSW